MSPVPPVGRRASLAILLLAVSLAAAVLGAPAVAQEAGAKTIERTLTVGVVDSGCTALGLKDPCWDTKVLVANPGDKITLIADLRNSEGTHNLHVKGIDPEVKTKLSSGELHMVNFTMPSGNKGVTFVCDAHATMTASILPPAEAAKLGAAGGESDVPKLGVGHDATLLSYWVGVIAFALLFITYGATFFLFKYNETPATTDQWDRTGSEGIDAPRRFSPGMASILAIVLAAVVIGGIVYVARLA